MSPENDIDENFEKEIDTLFTNLKDSFDYENPNTIFCDDDISTMDINNVKKMIATKFSNNEYVSFNNDIYPIVYMIIKYLPTDDKIEIREAIIKLMKEAFKDLSIVPVPRLEFDDEQDIISVSDILIYNKEDL